MREDYKIFIPVNGNNRIRILPPTWENPDHYGYDIRVHFYNGMYVCNDGECCTVSDVYPVKRLLTWILHDGEVKLWFMPFFIDKSILEKSLSEKGYLFDISSPSNGFDVIVDKIGKGMMLKYKIGKIRKSKPQKLSDEVLDYISNHPLPEVAREFHYNSFIIQVKEALKEEDFKAKRKSLR